MIVDRICNHALEERKGLRVVTFLRPQVVNQLTGSFTP